MAPCKVAIVLAESRLDLVIPYDLAQPFGPLIEMIIARATKHSAVPLTLAADSIQLRLNGADGFIIDQDDRVEDVMTPADLLFVIPLASISDLSRQPATSTNLPATGRYRVRAITPLAAQRHGDVRHIPLLRNGFEFSRATTLRELKADVTDHLGIRSYESGVEDLSDSVIDLHTAEGPIETWNLDLTAGTTHLTDLVVNGVLSIYAVERKVQREEITPKKIGKDAMFQAARHWEIPSVQSERGMAAFLSCLRVFAHITGAEAFTEFQQNEVLRLYHHLTGFPPAVRAMHILMDGKTLRPCESAALVQCTSAVLQDLIPKNIIENDSRRALEGTRLLFGLLLQRSDKMEKKQREVKGDTEELKLIYVSEYYTVDLRDVKTQEPVKDPIQTDFGLVDRSTYDALSRQAENNMQEAYHPDIRALRVAILFGGVAPETPYYNADALNAQYMLSSKATSENLSNELKALSRDLNYVAMLCEETELTVTPPKVLSGTHQPCLTLDRQGHNAVYTGPPPCAPPDRDKGIFKPLTGSEEQIDANIVTQLLEPILKARERDGTAVFDIFKTSGRKSGSATSELLIFCVDCSASMEDSSNFPELNDAAPGQASSNLEDVNIEDETDEPITFNEMKDWLLAHESLDDILALICCARSRATRSTAEEIIGFLRTLCSRQISHHAKDLRNIASWATQHYLQASLNRRSSEKIDALRRTLSGLTIFEAPLCDLLIFRAKDPSFMPLPYSCSLYDPIPAPEGPPVLSVDVTEDFTVPPEYMCPISQMMFKDPVTTADGFTFERKSIERWYRIRHSSPLTGLPQPDTTLRRNQPLFDQIQSWVHAQDIIQAAPSTPKRTRRSNLFRSGSESDSGSILTFVAPTGTFARTLRSLSTLADLHKVAFRGMRGAYTRFNLHCNGRPLMSSNSTLRDGIIADGSEIVVTQNTDTATASADSSQRQAHEMCLIEIYTPAHRYSDALFSYWVPRSTSATLASILFRFWRHFQHSWKRMDKVFDREIWSGLHPTGDGRYQGDLKNTWESLATTFSRLSLAAPKLKEPMCKENVGDIVQSNDWTDSEDSDLGMYTNQSANFVPASAAANFEFRVLKVELDTYISPEARETRRQEKLRQLTRMGICKQVFGSFINRLIAYNYPTAVGLVTFGTSANLTLQLTDTIENFRTAVDAMETAGDTCLYDALALAVDQLNNVSQEIHTSSEVRKRIICLSDGHDTKSSRTAMDVCRLLVQNSIVVDSCSIGNEDNSDLRTISYLTGGYKFVPNSLESAVAVCELEPVLSLHERPPAVRPMIPAFLTSTTYLLAMSNAQPDPVSRDVFPTRKAHPNINDSFVRITALERSSATTNNSTDNNVSGLRTRRLLTEIRDMATHPHPSYDVYVSETNMGFWKVVIAGPNESAYATGTFLVYLDFGDDYPRAAPKGRFITPIFHPNINRHGRICHSIFDRNWTVDTTSRQVLDTVFGLMLVPEFTDPINTVVTLNYYWDEVAFKAEVEKHIETHAAKGREEFGKMILGE